MRCCVSGSGWARHVKRGGRRRFVLAAAAIPFFFFSFFFFGLVEYCVGTSVRVRACRFTINDQYDEAVESFGPSAVCFLPEWLL